jgi:uncharacterized protein DUF4123
MITTFDVAQRHAQLCERMSALRLYALVDGAQYQQHRTAMLTPQPGMRALFAGTQDAPLAHAGPWLIDTSQVQPGLVAEFVGLELQAPAVTWLIAPLDLEGLAQLLQLHLDLRLPDGRMALLRFWDPRVLATLAGILNAEQRESFFGHIHEWHLLHNGQRAWIGRHHAHAQ